LYFYFSGGGDKASDAGVTKLMAAGIAGLLRRVNLFCAVQHREFVMKLNDIAARRRSSLTGCLL